MSTNKKSEAIAVARAAIIAESGADAAAAIQRLIVAGAAADPEGARLIAELAQIVRRSARADALATYRGEAQSMSARHAAERNQLLARARAVINDVEDSELFGNSSYSNSKNLPFGKYVNPDGRTYVLHSGSRGRRPDWLDVQYLVSDNEDKQ
jgi:hypothetical protein